MIFWSLIVILKFQLINIFNYNNMKILRLIYFCTILIFNGLTAQEVVPLWDNESIPNYQKSDAQEVIPPRDILFIQNVQTPTLQIFLPSKQNMNGMAVLICPAGGYSGVSYDWEGTDYAK